MPRALRSTGLQHRYNATAADFAELYGSTLQDKGQAKHLGQFADQSFAPLSGYAFGPNRNNVTLTTDNKVTNADPRINNAVFVPTSGYRHASVGAVYWIGSWGGSWSSTASTSTNGHYFEFNSITIWPQGNDRRTLALPVRCIRD